MTREAHGHRVLRFMWLYRVLSFRLSNNSGAAAAAQALAAATVIAEGVQVLLLGFYE